MKIDFLKNRPQTIPELAEWLYEDWHTYDKALTKEKLVASFKSWMNDDRIPMTLVVMKGKSPIGVISLKTEPEFSEYPPDSLWIGSLHVTPKERNQGIGGELVKVVQQIAAGFGHKELYFYTSNPSNVPWYQKRGAELLEKRPFRGHQITVMRISLKKSATRKR